VNKYLSRLADYYGLAQLHREKSRESQFAAPVKVCPGVHDGSGFYPTPAPCEIAFQTPKHRKNYQVGQFIYPSEYLSDFPNNNFVTGSYYKPDSLAKSLQVIIVHGWRMNSLARVRRLFLNPFLAKGYHLYFFTLPYHFERTPASSLYNGELMISANIDRTLAAIQQAVTDLRALVRRLKNNGGKVALIGISLGGLITNLVGAFETEIDALISIFYANSLADSVWKTIPGKYIKQDFEKYRFTYEALKKCWQITEPSNFKPCLPQSNILLMSAAEDQYIDAEDSEALWKAWDQPTRIIYPCAHSGLVFLRKTIGAAGISFLETICGGTPG
jgi:dienelactone hydrolase